MRTSREKGRRFLTADLLRLFTHQLLDASVMIPRVIATGWLVLKITDAPFWVGAIFGIEGIMLLSCGGIGGVLAARVKRRLVLAVVHASLTVVLIVIAVLSWFEILQIWHLILFAVFTGLGRCLHIPLLNGLLHQAAGNDQLVRAIGARFLTYNIGRMIGAAAVGVIIATFGIAPAFLFLAVVRAAAAFILTRLSSEIGRSTSDVGYRLIFTDMVRQFRYTLKVPRIRSVFMMSMMMELCVFSFSAMLPVLARDVLDVGPVELGMLSAAGSIGSILCGLVISASGTLKVKGSTAVSACVLCGICLVGYALSRWFLLSMTIAVGFGVAAMIYDVMIFTLAQVTVPSARRDQSMGLLAQTFGLNPIGSTLTGALAQLASLPAALFLSGGIIIVYSLTVLVPKRLFWDRSAIVT